MICYSEKMDGWCLRLVQIKQSVAIRNILQKKEMPMDRHYFLTIYQDLNFEKIGMMNTAMNISYCGNEKMDSIVFSRCSIRLNLVHIAEEESQ